MDRNIRNTQNRAAAQNALEAAQLAALETENRRKRAMLCAWGSITAMALVATIGLAEGCAHDHTRVSSEVSNSSATQQAVVASTEGMSTGASSPLPESMGSGEGERSVPPDLEAAVSDTFVTAGQPIEVVVQGTTDITEMALADGRGDPIPMVRDSTDDTWRVDYRVPLKPKQNRLGLSVTAKNEHGKWVRRWVFLTVDDGKQQVESEPDTTSQH
jgi:SH3-like domain-containing protein